MFTSLLIPTSLAGMLSYLITARIPSFLMLSFVVLAAIIVF